MFDRDRVPYPRVQGGGGQDFPWCPTCGKNHGGMYLVGFGACYECGSRPQTI